MIESIFEGILGLFNYLLNLLLTPIDNLISSLLPNVSNLFDFFSDFCDWIIDLIAWVISYFGFSQAILNVLLIYFNFKYIVPFEVHLIKSFIRWYRSLK